MIRSYQGRKHRRPRRALFHFAWQQIHILAPFTKGYAWAAPVMAIASLSASLFEGLAVSVVSLFLYVAIGPGAQGAGFTGLLSRMFDAARTVTGDSNLGLAVLILCLVVSSSLLNLIYAVLASTIKNIISERARNKIYSQYLNVSYGYIRCRDYGDLVNILATESWNLAEAFYSFARMGTNIAAFVVFGAILLAISWQITLVAVVGSVGLFWGLHAFFGHVRRLGEVAREANRELAEQMVNTLQGMRTIRAYAQEAFRQRMFGEASARARRTLVRLDQIQAGIKPISEVAYLVLLAAIVGMASALDIPFVYILSAVGLLYRLRPHMREFEGTRLKLASLAASLAAVQSVVSGSDKSYAPVGWREFRGLEDEIRFERVSLTYPGADRESVKDVSFSIRRGSTTAIVGPSGAGKTTIVNLLLRLYEPSAGSILVDGTPLNVFHRSSWLARLAVAGQDAELIDDTIIENIRLAKPDASSWEIEQAARVTGIYDFIAGLPNGLDSWIGENGLNVSGGQRQRIGLARALIRHPALLILDEATSALEKSLEQEIRGNLATAMEGGTTIIITHRLDTILDVDHVICLSDGRVTDQGPADTVLSYVSASAPPMA